MATANAVIIDKWQDATKVYATVRVGAESAYYHAETTFAAKTEAQIEADLITDIQSKRSTRLAADASLLLPSQLIITI